jgi:hypothetical protein
LHKKDTMATIPSGSKIMTVASTVNTRERKSTQANSPTEYYTVDDIQETVLDLGTPPDEGDVLTYASGAPTWAPAAGGSDYTETIVNISSAQLISGDSVDLFTIPNGKYVRSLEIFLKFTEGSTPYTWGGLTNYITIEDFNSANVFLKIHKEIFEWWVTEGVPVVNNYIWFANSNIGNSIATDAAITGGHLTGGVNNKVIWRGSGGAFTLGNGSLQLICKYSFIDI